MEDEWIDSVLAEIIKIQIYYGYNNTGGFMSMHSIGCNYRVVIELSI